MKIPTHKKEDMRKKLPGVTPVISERVVQTNVSHKRKFSCWICGIKNHLCRECPKMDCFCCENKEHIKRYCCKCQQNPVVIERSLVRVQVWLWTEGL